jgi:hypothetical protein
LAYILCVEALPLRSGSRSSDIRLYIGLYPCMVTLLVPLWRRPLQAAGSLQLNVATAGSRLPAALSSAEWSAEAPRSPLCATPAAAGGAPRATLTLFQAAHVMLLLTEAAVLPAVSSLAPWPLCCARLCAATLCLQAQRHSLPAGQRAPLLPGASHATGRPRALQRQHPRGHDTRAAIHVAHHGIGVHVQVGQQMLGSGWHTEAAWACLVALLSCGSCCWHVKPACSMRWLPATMPASIRCYAALLRGVRADSIA